LLIKKRRGENQKALDRFRFQTKWGEGATEKKSLNPVRRGPLVSPGGRNIVREAS